MVALRNDSRMPVRAFEVFLDVYSGRFLISGHADFPTVRYIKPGARILLTVDDDDTRLLGIWDAHFVCGVDSVTFSNGRRWERAYPPPPL